MILIIIFILAVKPGKGKIEKKVVNKTDNTEVLEKSDIDEYVSIDLLLSPDDFIFPELTMSDMTDDYIDFLPGKKFSLPDFDSIIDDFNIIRDEAVKEDLLFDFEKRETEY